MGGDYFALVINSCRLWYRGLCRAPYDESLREGEGFFYFGGGEAVNWLTSSVMVKKISDLTLAQWLEVFDALRIQEAALRRQMAATVQKKMGKQPRK